MTHLRPSHPERAHPRLGPALALLVLALPALWSVAADAPEPDTLGKPRSGMALGGAVLNDPTRPPAFAMPAPPSASSPRAAANQSQTKTAAAVEAKPAASVLQAVQVPVRGPATAVVDGRMVQAGDTVDGHVVVSIDSQGLLLRNGKGNERMWLLIGNAKQTPDSIVATRSTSFTPAPQSPEAAPAPVNTAADRARTNPNTANAAPQGDLSLAGSN